MSQISAPETQNSAATDWSVAAIPKSAPDGVADNARVSKYWRTAAVTLLAAFLTFFLAESIARIMVISGKAPRSKAPEFERKLAVAADPAIAGRPLLFLGGSFTEHAIFPELLRTRLADAGIDVHPKNLGCRKTCLAEQLSLLETSLKACNEKPVVFYDLRQEAFSKKFITNDKLNETEEFLNTYAGRKTNGAKDLRNHVLLFFENHVCLVRDRAFLRDQLVSALGSVFNFEKRYAAQFERSYDFPITETSNFGTSAAYTIMTDQMFHAHTAGQTSKFEWSKEASADWTHEWFDVIRARCVKAGVPLVLLWLPEWHENGKCERNMELMTRFHQLADDKTVWFVDLHDVDNDCQHFRDRRHTNVLGAITTTEALAETLTKTNLTTIIQGGAN